MINLRGHHLFCTTLFEGFGYSENFAKNMRITIDKFENEDIKIVQNFDDICNECPHKSENNFCANGMENVHIRDKNSLITLGIKIGDVFSKQELFEKLNQVSEDGFNSVCYHCQWGLDGLCSFEKFKNRLTDNKAMF